MDKQEILKGQFKNAVLRLEEVLVLPKDPIVRDSAIQRFEFCTDLCWKFLKTILEDKYGVIVKSPKETFREAFTQKLIDYSDEWLNLVDLRNLTSHTYDEDLADQIYSQLPEALKHYQIIVSKFL